MKPFVEETTGNTFSAATSSFVAFINKLLTEKGMARKTLIEKLDNKRLFGRKSFKGATFTGLLSSVTAEDITQIAEILEFSWGDLHLFLEEQDLCLTAREARLINSVSIKQGVKFETIK